MLILSGLEHLRQTYECTEDPSSHYPLPNMVNITKVEGMCVCVK